MLVICISHHFSLFLCTLYIIHEDKLLINKISFLMWQSIKCICCSNHYPSTCSNLDRSAHCINIHSLLSLSLCLSYSFSSPSFFIYSSSLSSHACTGSAIICKSIVSNEKSSDGRMVGAEDDDDDDDDNDDDDGIASRNLSRVALRIFLIDCSFVLFRRFINNLLFAFTLARSNSVRWTWTDEEGRNNEREKGKIRKEGRKRKKERIEE